jgi:methylmalonyl-CoA/ethylmalonyl-CoA epimerase
MKITKIDHIGIAVKNLGQSSKKYSDILGIKVETIEEIPELGVKIAFIPVGDVLIELIQPMNENTPLYKRIEEKGEGVYHMAFSVDDIDQALDEMKAAKVPLRDELPRPGGMGSLIAMTKPEAFNDVVIELVQRS